MINLLLIEDEPAALRRLKRMVLELRPSWTIVNTADSVRSGIKAISNGNFDLILSDIQLSDGSCFDIFSASSVHTPVIFITAFDEYAIKAFEFNSIHYLLKPIKPDQLHQAFEKFEQNQLNSFEEQASFFSGDNEFQQKLLSKVGNSTTLIEYNDIAFIHHADRVTTAVLMSGKKHYLDHSLDKLEDYLPEEEFFRINRQAIVKRSAIIKYTAASSSRLSLVTKPISTEELIVSKDKTPYFKRWVSGETA